MKGLRLYIIGSAVLLVAYLITQYYQKEPTDWTSTYAKEDKIPFGTYILYNDISSIFPKSAIKTVTTPVYNTLYRKNLKNTNYLFITGSLKLEKLDYRELIKFIRNGNNVFIAAYDQGNLLTDSLGIEVKAANIYGNNNVSVYFVNPAFKGEQSYYFDKGIANQYFSKIDTARATVLGMNENGDANFIRYNFGKGALYLLPNPQLFTNYGLLSKSGTAYASKALSHLPVSETLMMYEDGNSKITNREEQSPLHVIFEHDHLRWAYEIAIFSIILFVLFEMKRRQRIIPIVSPLANSSVDFVKVVGRVYYQQRDNSDIAHKKINYFLEYIRTAYRVKTTAIDHELVASVVIKSGVSEDIVVSIFNKIQEIDQAGKVSDQQLIDLNKLIEKFHLEAH